MSDAPSAQPPEDDEEVLEEELWDIIDPYGEDDE